MKPKDYPTAMLKALVKAYDSDPNPLARTNGILLSNIAHGMGLVKMDKDKVVEEPNWSEEIWPALDELKRRSYVEVVREGLLIARVKPTPAGLDYGRGLLRPWWRNIFQALVKIPKAIYYLAAFLASALAIGKFLGFV